MFLYINIIIIFIILFIYYLYTIKSCKYINIYSSYLSKEQNNVKYNNINTLIRQSSRWAVASEQDNSPMIALLHANYAAGYLWALMDIYSSDEIYKATKVNISEFKNIITDIQDKATKKVSNACPNYTANINKYILKLGGDI
tara:strand:- start:4450 stop:4875 length:426 start_codon:yes stop_codon:yes gene_type:complete